MPSSQRDAGQTIAEIRGLLDRTRADLLSTLADDLDLGDLQPSDYDRFLAQQKMQAIDQALGSLEVDVVAIADDHLGQAAAKGADAIMERLERVEMTTPVIGVDTPTLALVQDLAGSQIKVALQEVKGKVNVAMQRAMAGGLDLRGLQREIRDAFKGNVTEGRVEKIIRTETVRAYSQSQAAADEQLVSADVDVQLIKRWRTVGDTRTRLEHALINGQERELWQLFNVGGGATASTPPDSNVGWEANGPAAPCSTSRGRRPCNPTSKRTSPRSSS